MKKFIIPVMLSATLAMASCQDNQTSLSDVRTIIMDTETIEFAPGQIPEGFSVRTGSDHNGTNYLDFYWPNFGTGDNSDVPNELDIVLTINTFGYVTPDNPIKFKLEQANLPPTLDTYISGYPGVSYEELANEGNVSIGSGAGKATVTVKLLLDAQRLDQVIGYGSSAVRIAEVGYLTTFGISAPDYSDDSTVLRVSDKVFQIRVRKGY